MKLIAAFLAFAMLAACSGSGGAPSSGAGVVGTPLVGPVSRLQCSSIVWYDVGLYDGSKDLAQPGRFSFLDNTCTGHGFTADREDYFRGYEAGQALIGG